MAASGKIKTLYDSVKGAKKDWKEDWKENSKQDWKFDFDALEGGSAPVVPSNSVLPSITGTAQVGETLTAASGTWAGSAPITYTRQWKANGTAISGATGTTYVPVEADIGKTITITITATNVAGNASATSAATAAVIEAEEEEVDPV